MCYSAEFHERSVSPHPIQQLILRISKTALLCDTASLHGTSISHLPHGEDVGYRFVPVPGHLQRASVHQVVTSKASNLENALETKMVRTSPVTKKSMNFGVPQNHGLPNVTERWHLKGYPIPFFFTPDFAGSCTENWIWIHGYSHTRT